MEAWAWTNNLTLNDSKMKEIIFTDNQQRRQVVPPSPVADIIRATSQKILDISIMNGRSASGHVQDIIQSYAQILYALRVLHACGMNNTVLQAIFRSTVVAELQYAASAWFHQDDWPAACGCVLTLKQEMQLLSTGPIAIRGEM
jgi:hypothetical protein